MYGKGSDKNCGPFIEEHSQPMEPGKEGLAGNTQPLSPQSPASGSSDKPT